MEKTPWWQVALLFAGVGLIAGLCIGMAIGWRMDSTTREVPEKGNETTSTETTASTTSAVNSENVGVVVNEQPSGKAVVVATLNLPETGWVAIHEVIDGETMGNVLGAARRDAGVHSNVIVNLLRATEPGKEYAVVLYADNGNGDFDLKTDIPITTESGDPIVVRFNTRTPTSAAGE